MCVDNRSSKNRISFVVVVVFVAMFALRSSTVNGVPSSSEGDRTISPSMSAEDVEQVDIADLQNKVKTLKSKIQALDKQRNANELKALQSRVRHRLSLVRRKYLTRPLVISAVTTTIAS